ncbi:MAG: asparaginase, partial [Thermoleophilaceae bacterium]|nr:asparaginase [Thermoleophilaceae bacterium]
RPTDGGGVVAGVSGGELLAAVPGLAHLESVVVREVINVGSYLLSPEQVFQIARSVRDAAEEFGVRGVVVTHGTDTMEESAYLCDLIVRGDAPVVFTGAQRNAAAPDSDGPNNLRDAIAIARSDAARGAGALIAMNGRIVGARSATKVHSFALEAFGGLDRGELGDVYGGEVRVLHDRRRPGNLAGIDAIEPRVALVKLVAGIDGLFVRAAVEAGMRGLILECFGVGNANHAVLDAVGEAVRAGVVVVVVSRCPNGSVAPIYGNGGGHDLREAGALFGGDLSGQHARILLMAALGTAHRPGDVEELLEPHLSSS